VNVAKHRAFFEQRASESNKTQTPERLDRAAIPKRLGTGMHPYTVVWEPMARDNLPHVERVPSRDEAIDRPQTMQPGKSTKTPGPVVNHLANIVRNRKAELQAREASVAPVSENVGQPAKFSMARVAAATLSRAEAPSQPAFLPTDGQAAAELITQFETQLTKFRQDIYSDVVNRRPSRDVLLEATREDSRMMVENRFAIRFAPSGAPEVDAANRALSISHEALYSFQTVVYGDDDGPSGVLVDSHIDSSQDALSPASDMNALSDYESDSPGSSAESSPPGSPNALNPVIPWSLVRAEAMSQPAFLPPDESVTVTELKDALGQLERAVDNENKYRMSDDAIDLLDLAMGHYRNGNVQSAHAAAMRALDGVTEILSPVDSDYASVDTSDSEGDDVVGTMKRPVTDAQRVRELRIIQKELFDTARKYPGSERGIAARNLHSANQRMFEAVGARTTYDGAVRLMPGIRSMSTARMA